MTTDGQRFPMTWYFVDPSTPLFPARTVFSSLNWTRPHWSPTPNLGEVIGAPRPWRSGSRPDLVPGPGVFPLTGLTEWFFTGAPPGAADPPVWGGMSCPVVVTTPCRPFPLPRTMRCRISSAPGCFLWDGDVFDITYLGSGIWGADNIVNLAPGFGRLFVRMKCDGPFLWRANVGIGQPVDPTIGYVAGATITPSPLTFDATFALVPAPVPFSTGPCCGDPGVVHLHVWFPP